MSGWIHAVGHGKVEHTDIKTQGRKADKEQVKLIRVWLTITVLNSWDVGMTTFPLEIFTRTTCLKKNSSTLR